MLGRSSWPQRFLGAAAWIVGARARVTGSPLRPHTLIVANHVSWLDILVLGGTTGTAFVSKDDLGHGLFHWLADQNETIYVSREQRRAAPEQARSISDALRKEKPVTIFPEGTVGPGDELLPFRSALLAAAASAPAEIDVRPVAIDYGPAAPEISWHGQRGRDNVISVLGRRGTLPVTVRVLPPLERSADRKRLAQEARERIAEALGFKSEPHSPIATGK